VDTGLFMLALWLAHALRHYVDLGRDPIFPFEDFIWLWLVVAPAAPLFLTLQGFYDRPLFFSRAKTAWMLFKAAALTTVTAIIAMFLFREQLARGVLVLFGVISFALVYGKELLLHRLFASGYGQEQHAKRVILAGSPAEVGALRERLQTLARGSLVVADTLDLNRQTDADLVRLLHHHAANAVIISARHTVFGQVEKAILACEIEGVETWLVADFFPTETFRTSLDDFYGIPMVVFRSAPEASWQLLAKQILDYAGALAGVILLSWLFLLIAVLIRLGSAGPVFFRQRRCGLHGQPFTMLKFRSMISDAEQRRDELEALNEMSGPVFKVSNDPRVTAIGRFLRKYSLDELPQLFNVLKGDMSLVGPRPLPVSEVERFNDPAHRRRLSVKPGLTCLWQVSGRNEVRDFKEWVRLDLEYIDNWSLWLDIKILLRTVPAVLQTTGAK